MNVLLPPLRIRLVGLLMLWFITVSSHAQSTAPIAHWRFDDQPGSTTAADSAGAFTGTLSASGASFITSGRAGNALSLDRATGGFVSMGNVLSFRTGTNFTLVAWVRTTDLTPDAYILGKHSASPAAGYSLNMNPAGATNPNGRVMLSENGVVAQGVASTTLVNDGNWHQIVAVYQSSSGSKSIYVDGSPVEQSNFVQGLVTNSLAFLIGGVTTGGSPAAAFTGSIDDVQVYNRPLSTSEIDYLFNNPGAEITSTTVTGVVRNALNGQALAGALVRLNGGASVVSGAQGQFTFANVPVSDVSITATATGFIGYSNTFTLVIAPSNPISFAMSPLISSGSTMRLVLNWGAAPSDLDSHLQTPQINGTSYHVYYANRGTLFADPFAALDVDDVNGFGPETITITNFFTGTYHYYIHNFSGSPPLAGCGATAQLYTGAGLVAAVQVPATGVGDYWYVARIDGASRYVTIINQITNNVPVVLGAPSFSLVPVSVTTNAGATVFFSVAATGNSPLSYQWRLNGVNVVGATSATLVLNNIQAVNAGTYTCVVSNPLGSVTSPGAILSVNVLAPVIISSPQSYRVLPGTNVTFGVTVTGPGPFNYQWRYNGSAILGANAATFSLGNVQFGNAGIYTVVINNPYGTIVSTPGVLDVLSPPVVTVQPVDVAAARGEPVSFSAAHTGSSPFTYQWQLDGVPILGGTNLVLGLFNVQFSQAGNYSLVISNDAGSVTTSNALLVVNSPPIITAQPAPRTVTAGNPVTIAASIIGSPLLAYQWQLDGADLPGANSNSLTLAAAQVSDRGLYTLVITNDFGSVTSSPAFLAVHPVAVSVGWTGQAGGPGVDVGNACATDNQGNLFVAGYFTGTATFGTNTLVSAGQNDIFVAKYSGAGVLLWVRRAGGQGYDTASGIAVDAAGNAYVTGAFEGNADFGTNVLTNANASSYSDIFVAKLDPTGNVLWTVTAGEDSISDVGNAIALDPNGNVLVAGRSGLTTFGAAPVVGNGRIFLAKFDNNGNPVWARACGLPGIYGGQDSATAVGTDGAGNIFLAGNFEGPTATFGTATLTNRGVSDGFLAVFDAGGTPLRVLQIGGAGTDRVNGLAVDASGNAHVAGDFSGTLTLGAVGPRVATAVAGLTSAGQADGFVAKFDPAGGLLWAQASGGAGSDSARGIALGADGSVHVTGYFSGTAAFGTNTLASSGATLDIFTARYTASGQLIFAQQSGGDDLNGDYGSGIAVDTAGNSFVTGQFSGTTTIGATARASTGGGDVFVARFEVPQLAPPQVTFQISNGQLILTWPVAALGWGLQNAPTNPVPGGWLTAPHSIMVVSNQYVVTIPLAGQKGFFRLVR